MMFLPRPPFVAFLASAFAVMLFTFDGLWAAEKASSSPRRSEVFYFLLTDRFADGDPQNNKGFDRVPVSAPDTKEDILRHGYEPTLDTFYHGGDFAGVIQKLDYLQSLGVTAIWLSPIFKNKATQAAEGPLGASAGYHGYWVSDFTTVDPHWGTDDDFKRLIEAAHKRGIKVFIDAIVNHTADMISYRECQQCPYRSRAEYPYQSERKGRKLNPGFIDGDRSAANFARLKDPDFAYTPFFPQPKLKKKPDWLNNPIYYHNRGNSTFSGENSELGDFYGLDDLFTEHPRVLSGMIEIYSDWIKKYKFDGLRVDTVKHVNIEFWQEFVPALREAAKAAGVPDFFIFGEVFSADPVQLSTYTRLGKMDSVLDFNFQAAVKDVFANGQPAERLHAALEADDLHRLGSSPQKMMTFISNHDLGRLAYFMKSSFKDASEAELLKRLTLAHAYLFFARGIPVLYYGDEQGLVGFGGDTGAREDMFATRTPSYQALMPLGGPAQRRDHFNPEHPLYRAIQSMSRFQKEHPELQEGEYVAVRGLGDDILAFERRIFGAEESYLLLFNMHASEQRQLPLVHGGRSISPLFPEEARAQQSAAKLSLPPLSFAVSKISRPKNPAQPSSGELQFKDLAPGQPKAGLFFAELNLPPSAEARVNFATRAGKATGPFTPLYVDSNPPYRAYIDGSAYPDGTEFWLRADVELLGPKKETTRTSLLRHLTIDSRPPLVSLIYENPRDRSEAFTISGKGRIALPSALEKGNKFEFSWPLEEEQHLVFFAGAEKGQRAYDRPLLLSYREHILPHLQKGPKGQTFVNLYVNSRLELAFDKLQPQGLEAAAPALPLGDARAEKAPLGSEALFLRGGMNTWETKNPLLYQGRFTYAAGATLSPGAIEFKCADRDWQAAFNFGAPVTQQGLSASGGSGNLSVIVPPGGGGDYQFELVAIPAGLMGGQSLHFMRIAPEKK